MLTSLFSKNQVSSIQSGSSLATTILFAIAGLALFIYSTKTLSTSLKTIGDVKFNKIMKFISKNRFIAMLIGMLVTTMIQSSDGAVALIMGLLAARLINLRIAIAFLLGANIGTATTSIVVALEPSVGFTQYFILLLFIGVFGFLITKKIKWQTIFMIIFSIGLIFFSLKLLSSQSKQLIKQDFFRDILVVMGKNPWSAFLISFLFTGILQSSSATVTLYQTLFSAGESALKLNSALGLVLGANVGTTITGLIVSFASNNSNSKKIAIIWGITNFSISFILLPFLYPLSWYSDFVKLIIPDSNPDIKSFQLSVGHLLFNIILVSIFIWLISYLEKFVNFIVKGKSKIDKEFEIILPDELIKENTYLSLQAVKKAIYTLSIISTEGLQIIANYLKTGNNKILNRYNELERIVDNTRTDIYNYLVKISANNLSKEEAQLHLSLILSSRSIDKVMNLGLKVIKEFEKVFNSKKELFFNVDSELINETREILSLLRMMIKKVTTQIDKHNIKESRAIKKINNNIEALSHDFLKINLQRLKNEQSQKLQLKKGFDFDLVLRSLERISHHCMRIDDYIANTRFKLSKMNQKESKEFALIHEE
ncbi:Na/Pi cotransporter family protein [Mycoplasmopsis cricetuli]|uniref:Na/Pi cotransporter family protein n=1 Tax=Mycoplasmopsis cricetuli TaxID=171283 RepID=UPI000472E91A|nr:Na/Pi symporter [Mycoplasmopsis cricetuli]